MKNVVVELIEMGEDLWTNYNHESYEYHIEDYYLEFTTKSALLFKRIKDDPLQLKDSFEKIQLKAFSIDQLDEILILLKKARCYFDFKIPAGLSSKARPKIKQVTKVRSLLQQQINSICPFCSNSDVGHFQIHHIDENPANNDLSNLILVCPSCHSKITKGDISSVDVIGRKNLSLKSKLIVCDNVAIDHENCSWVRYPKTKYAFKDQESTLSPFPILNFSLINHSKEVVLLKEIQLKTEHLFSGFSGLPMPILLKPVARFKMAIPHKGEVTSFELSDEIAIPAEQPVKVQIQLYDTWQNEYIEIQGRKVLHFIFTFSRDVKIEVQSIFLNCKSAEEKITVHMLN